MVLCQIQSSSRRRGICHICKLVSTKLFALFHQQLAWQPRLLVPKEILSKVTSSLEEPGLGKQPCHGRINDADGFIRTNVWAIMRNGEVFGAHPEYFRPERWLNASKESYSRMERTVDLIFGYGRYRCLGAPVAWLEFNKVFVEILRRFDITVLNPSKPMTSIDHGVWIQTDFLVKIVDREIAK
jgi:Cytochrome P450